MDALKDTKETNLKAASDNNSQSDDEQFEKDAEVKSRKKLDIDGESLLHLKDTTWGFEMFLSLLYPIILETEFEAYLISSVFMLFFAGFNTTSTILSAFMYFMGKNLDIQEKLFEEVKLNCKYFPKSVSWVQIRQASLSLKNDTILDKHYMIYFFPG